MKKKVKEWIPPNRPSLSELKSLAKDGWRVEEGYLFDHTVNDVVLHTNTINDILLKENTSRYSAPMVYFKMIWRN